ncbi:MAG: helix-turn-helix domain-containing protein [Lachnospiraceae bacterium]|nr:helix-turn-helix domain-containing protein [Lachnospiraceae bacterium]
MANKSNKELNLEYGALLKMARKRKNVSQDEMAEQIHMSKGHISVLERGSSKVSVETLMDYCRVLDTTPNDILKVSEADISPRLGALLYSMSMEKQEMLAEILEKSINLFSNIDIDF